MSTAVLERGPATEDGGFLRRIPTSAELREMSDEEVRQGSRRHNENEPDLRVKWGHKRPTRGQNPYEGERLRRFKLETGRENRPRLVREGLWVSTRLPDAAKVAATYPGFPSSRLWVLQEILEIIASNSRGNADYSERMMSRRTSIHHLQAIAEGREDDVYRELWWGKARP